MNDSAGSSDTLGAMMCSKATDLWWGRCRGGLILSCARMQALCRRSRCDEFFFMLIADVASWAMDRALAASHPSHRESNAGFTLDRLFTLTFHSTHTCPTPLLLLFRRPAQQIQMHFSLFTCEQDGVSTRVRSTYVLVVVLRLKNDNLPSF